jgi:hypothetical protein
MLRLICVFILMSSILVPPTSVYALSITPISSCLDTRIDLFIVAAATANQEDCQAATVHQLNTTVSLTTTDTFPFTANIAANAQDQVVWQDSARGTYTSHLGWTSVNVPVGVVSFSEGTSPIGLIYKFSADSPGAVLLRWEITGSPDSGYSVYWAAGTTCQLNCGLLVEPRTDTTGIFLQPFDAGAWTLRIRNDEGLAGAVGTGEMSATFDFALEPVPEPTTLMLFGTSLVVVGLARRKRRRQREKLAGAPTV